MKYSLLAGIVSLAVIGVASLHASSTTASAECNPGWTAYDSPNAGTGHNELVAVAAVSPDDVWAVGFVTGTPSGSSNQLIVHWDGTAWTTVPAPDKPNGYSLIGLSAVSASDIWAVGGSVNDAANLHWDGAAWSVADSPSGLNNPTLLGVAAVSSTDVWAVGHVLTGTPSDPGTATLIEHWDGTAWTVVASPSPGSQSGLAAVSAVSASDVWAVGKSDSDVLTEHWDGTSWAVVPTGSNSQPDAGFLDGVAAISANDVWAVGGNPDGTEGLLEYWNGTSWTLRQHVPMSARSDVAAFSANDVWAAGSVMSHWDGTSWGIVPGTNEKASFSAVSVAADGALRDVWAVGLLNNDVPGTIIDRKTHTERFCGEAVTTATPPGPSPTIVPKATAALPIVLPSTGGSSSSGHDSWLLIASGTLLLAGIAIGSARWARRR